MRISDIMSRAPLTVGPECTLERAIAIMGERRLRHLPVVDHGRLAGIVSERDLLEATGWEPARYFDSAERRERAVRDTMSVAVETIAPEEDPSVAAARMRERLIGCLPVVEGSALVGLLCESDLLRAYAGICASPPLPPGFDPPVSKVMQASPLTVTTGERAGEALRLAHEQRVRHLAVLEDGWFVGIVSDRDLRLCAGRGELDRRTVGEILSADLLTVAPDERLSRAARLMLRHRVGSVAVTAAGRLLGIATSADVLEQCCSVRWESIAKP